MGTIGEIFRVWAVGKLADLRQTSRSCLAWYVQLSNHINTLASAALYIPKPERTWLYVQDYAMHPVVANSMYETGLR